VMNWCCLCKNSGESIDCLFLHCGVARELWVLVLNVFGVEWLMYNQVVELFTSLSG
jgi:hypothetical protein